MSYSVQFEENTQEGCEILDGALGTRMSLEGSEQASANVGAIMKTVHRNEMRCMLKTSVLNDCKNASIRVNGAGRRRAVSCSSARLTSVSFRSTVFTMPSRVR